ncbi:MAG: aminopeptidase P family protein [Peptococcaceae bacterium]|nr:aminopeptidase P family protein [Peptococcaceae bacterium]
MSRIAKLRERMVQKDLPAFLVSSSSNRRYLSGFTGTAGSLLISLEKAFLLTDFRYVEQARAQCPGWEIVRVDKDFYESLATILGDYQIDKLGFEVDYITFHQYQQMREAFKGVSLEPLKGLVEELRVVKDEEEIAAIARAVRLIDKTFEYVMNHIRPGRIEREVVLELEFFARRAGATGMSFETILASGERAALPHGVASGKVINKGDLVVLDCGAVLDGYCSDFTRSLVAGAAPAPWQQEIYNIVLEAQEIGLETLRAGVKGSEVDSAVRNYIAKYGYEEYFGHSTGHGLGIDVHEEPRLSAVSDRVLEEGMVVTVEPGIYLPGKGGVRIEDVAVVRKNGCEILTKSPKKELITLY